MNNIEYYGNKFHERVNYLVDTRGKSIRATAIDIDMHPISLGRLLKETRMPQMDSLLKIATGFGVSVDWLIGLSDEKDSFSKEAYDLIALYAVARTEDRQAINSILQKYKR